MTSSSTHAPRTAQRQRKTSETDIEVRVNLDGTGVSNIDSGIAFLDHMLTALSKHSRIDIDLRCKGDLHIDDHHSAEDCAITLGAAIDEALGDRRGIVRFGYAYAPLDESLARAVLDLSGRPWPEIHLDFRREMLGKIATENVVHVLRSLAIALRANLHVDVLRGDNDHHKSEAAFKATAIALRQACARSGTQDIASTKGSLS